MMTEDAKKVTYKKAIVSFIDILGFRGLVEEHKEKPGIILNILKNVEEKVKYHRLEWRNKKEEIFDSRAREYLEREREYLEKSKIYFFSDSIVLIQECLPETHSLFFLEILTIHNIQSHLATEGIFVRGGVTYGDIFYEENRLFGPALIRAYDLESQYADFPRVLVDEGCRDDFNYTMNWFEERGQLKKDKDGFLCIDHLSCLGLGSNFGEERIGLRDKIKFHIEKNIKEYKDKERILRKYYWLANEYNEVFSKEDSHIDIEKLLAE